jgi:hypothetical protein
MGWFTYTGDVEDGSSVHGDGYLNQLLKSFASEPNNANIVNIMVEFADGSFLRVEKAGVDNE